MAVVCCQYSPTDLPKRLDSPFLGRPLPLLGKSSFGQTFLRPVHLSKINAIFWGPRKTVEPRETDLSLGKFNLTGLQGDTGSELKPQKISLSVVSSISKVSSDDWDACALDATGPEKFNPFLTHGFLSSLEESGCAVKETGWLPRHIIAQDELENIIGVVPLYLKSHSYGEFVFDYSWADAYYSFGSSYYPKLQCCVPFTPVTGQRILIRNTWFKDQVFEKLVSALKDLTAQFEVSSLHMTFPSENEWHKMKEHGFLQRIGMQYHWKNRNYRSFDDYLMDMKQSKRKNIRQERKKISAQNLKMKRLRGDDIKARHWDSFYEFYRNTTDNKWGRAFLTRDFFHNMGAKMGDKVLLIVAEEEDELVAGALNLIGGDTLFGRLWGCLPRAYYPSLHFEACYYQDEELPLPAWVGADSRRSHFPLSEAGQVCKIGDICPCDRSSWRHSIARVTSGAADFESWCLLVDMPQKEDPGGMRIHCDSRRVYEQLPHEQTAAIEAAIEMNLEKVEAGAQGEHKIQRGYLPVTTYSCHYILDGGFRKAIQDFLVRETDQVKHVMTLLHDSSPFKDSVEY